MVPISSAPAVGELAPDFSLYNTAGRRVSVSQFRHTQHVLLAFFPLAFTSTCTAELCAFTEDFDQFTTQDVTILPISVDAVPSLKEFKAKYAMHVDLLSDFKREASRAYGVLREESYVSKRAYFLIDQSGVIRWSHIEDTAHNRRENSEILAAIASLKG